MTLIIFESHATSLDNERGIASGDLNPLLSVVGNEQARVLGERYLNIELAAVCCSDLLRSYQTAEVAFKGRSIPIIKDKRLREWNYGSWNGRSTSEVDRQKKLHIEMPFPEGESMKQAMTRILNFYTEISTSFPNQPLLFIGHRIVYYTFEHFYRMRPLLELLEESWKWQPGWHYLTRSLTLSSPNL